MRWRRHPHRPPTRIELVLMMLVDPKTSLAAGLPVVPLLLKPTWIELQLMLLLIASSNVPSARGYWWNRRRRR